MAIISIEFSGANEIYQGYVIMAIGLSQLAGPIMNIFLFTLLGYAGELFFFSALIAIGGLTSSCCLPKRLNSSTLEEKLVDDEVLEISYSEFF